VSSNLTDQQKPNPRRYLTLPIPLNNNYSQSPAEHYIACRSQMLNKSIEQQDISPETSSSITGTNINSIQSSMSHAEKMHKWHQEQTEKIFKKQKHRYVYGPPPSSSVTSPTSLGLQFSSAMYFSPVAPLNNIQSSMTSTRTIKKDNLTERSKANESRDRIKNMSSV